MVCITLRVSVAVVRVVRVVRVAVIRIHRLDACRVVVTVIVGDDGCVGRDRVAVRTRAHIIVRLNDAVSGGVAIAAAVTGVRVVSTAAARGQTGSSE